LAEPLRTFTPISSKEKVGTLSQPYALGVDRLRTEVMTMDEKRIELLEARVAKLDRLVYRVFELIKQLFGEVRGNLDNQEDRLTTAAKKKRLVF
jgi:hypothetical protein